MRILITGSRNYTNLSKVKQEIQRHATCEGQTVIIHGAAKGADSLADLAARQLGYSVEKYPADWSSHGRAAGPIRNQLMVDKGADICLAFPIGNSRGTYDCMNRARQAGIHVVAN